MKHATFRRKRYRVTTDETVQGYCEVPSKVRQLPELYIDGHLTGRTQLRVALHEALHACLPAASEHDVDESSTDIARFLWRLGYRLKQD